MSNQYKFGLFGCFGDFKLCVMSFCAPCYVVGKNAEHFGEDCMLHGLLTMVGIGKFTFPRLDCYNSGA